MYNHIHFSGFCWACWAFKGTVHPKHQTATTMDGKSTEVSLFTTYFRCCSNLINHWKERILKCKAEGEKNPGCHPAHLTQSMSPEAQRDQTDLEKKKKVFTVLKLKAISTSMSKCLKHIFFGWIVPLRFYYLRLCWSVFHTMVGFNTKLQHFLSACGDWSVHCTDIWLYCFASDVTNEHLLWPFSLRRHLSSTVHAMRWRCFL